MEIKSIKSLIKELCQLEGKKVQIDVAQMSEIVSKLSALTYLCPEVVALLVLHGKTQVKKYKKALDEEE